MIRCCPKENYTNNRTFEGGFRCTRDKNSNSWCSFWKYAQAWTVPKNARASPVKTQYSVEAKKSKKVSASISPTRFDILANISDKESENEQEEGKLKADSEDDSSDEEELPPQKIVTKKKKLMSNHKEKNKGQKQGAAAPKKAKPTFPHTTTKKTLHRGYDDHDDPFCVEHSWLQQKVQT